MDKRLLSYILPQCGLKRTTIATKGFTLNEVSLDKHIIVGIRVIDCTYHTLINNAFMKVITKTHKSFASNV